MECGGEEESEEESNTEDSLGISVGKERNPPVKGVCGSVGNLGWRLRWLFVGGSELGFFFMGGVGMPLSQNIRKYKHLLISIAHV